MNAVAHQLSRRTVAVASTAHPHRLLSTNTNTAVKKLRVVLEEYRQVHYRQEIPMRFKKELIAAACKSNNTAASTPNKAIKMEGMQQVLTNIGANDRISTGDLRMIFNEVGNSAGEIPSDRFLQMI